MDLYRSLIRSQLDHGTPIYNLADRSVLALLNTVQNTSLKLALGAGTSPEISLCAEAADPLPPLLTVD